MATVLIRGVALIMTGLLSPGDLWDGNRHQYHHDDRQRCADPAHFQRQGYPHDERHLADFIGRGAGFVPGWLLFFWSMQAAVFYLTSASNQS